MVFSFVRTLKKLSKIFPSQIDICQQAQAAPPDTHPLQQLSLYQTVQRHRV